MNAVEDSPGNESILENVTDTDAHLFYVEMGNVDTHSTKKVQLRVDLKIAGLKMNLRIDTGADVTIIPKKFMIKTMGTYHWRKLISN
jgi:hypothetical protein